MRFSVVDNSLLVLYAAVGKT